MPRKYELQIVGYEKQNPKSMRFFPDEKGRYFIVDDTENECFKLIKETRDSIYSIILQQIYFEELTMKNGKIMVDGDILTYQQPS